MPKKNAKQVRNRTRRAGNNSNNRKRKTNSYPQIPGSRLQGTERIKTITIPTDSTAGKVLAKVYVSPISAPRASTIAAQFDSWSGTISLEAESTGNAFSQNYIILHHFPDADGTRIPTDADLLLAAAETTTHRMETARLQLDSNKKATALAPWRLSYNAYKPLSSVNLSESFNGVFYVISNGSPGDKPVSVTLRMKYNIRFYGASFSMIPVLPNETPEIKGLREKLQAAMSALAIKELN